MNSTHAKAVDELELPAIINKPELQPNWRRGLYAAVAVCGWLVWFYLFLPLFTLVAWLFNLDVFNQNIVADFTQKWPIFAFYGLIIVLIGGVLLLWATYNYLRFRGRDRRSVAPPLQQYNLAVSFRLPVRYVHCMQNSQVLQVSHDPNGDIDEIDLHNAMPLRTDDRCVEDAT